MALVKRVYKELKASDKNCATCRFWTGCRKINTQKNMVKVRYDECAKCALNPDGVLGAPHIRCDDYEVLPELKNNGGVKINIRRGSNQIGGSAVEITAGNGERIVLDIGIPLDAEKNVPELLPKIKGLHRKTKDLLGVFISHAHQDHYGLGKWIDKKIPVYIGAAANKIIKAADSYLTRLGVTESFSFDNPVEISGFKQIDLGPFRITPYPVDHAAYESFAFLIEVDGKRIFYSGDFRTHGRCHKRTEYVIKRPPKNVDVLLMEGSSIERLNPDEHFESEYALERRFRTSFRSTPGLVLVHPSSQNIDRIVSIYRAAKEAGRITIMTSYTGFIMMELGNKNLPNFTWADVKKFSLKPTRRHEISPEQIAKNPGKYVYIVGASKLDSMARAGLLNENALYIYSMWDGYREENAKPVLEKMQNNNVKMTSIHTSGHADVPTLSRFVSAIKPKILIPIHTFYPEKFDELFGKYASVKMVSDNEDFVV